MEGSPNPKASLARLIDNRTIWRGEDLCTQKEPSFWELFPRGSAHQISSPIFNHHPPLHTPVALPLLITKKQASEEDLLKKVFIFIGKETFPSLFFLRDCFASKAKEVLQNSIYLNTRTDKETCWALETALSSTNVLCVMATIPSLSFSKSRRISLLTEKSGALCFLFPKKEILENTALRARWKLETQPTDSFHTQWLVTLLHLKGTKTKRSSWSICLDHEKEISVDLLPELVGEPDSIQAPDRIRA